MRSDKGNTLEQNIIAHLMHRLAERQAIFHDERDFQNEFAALLGKHFSTRYRLERKIHILDEPNARLDILLPAMRIGFELKYPTDNFYWNEDAPFTFNDESFSLKGTGEQEEPCYGIWKDASRIEHLKSSGIIDEGCTILLTNKSSMWKNPKSKSKRFEELRIFDGRKNVSGTLRRTTPSNTKQYAPIELKGKYNVNWHVFQCHPGLNGLFKFVILLENT